MQLRAKGAKEPQASVMSMTMTMTMARTSARTWTS